MPGFIGRKVELAVLKKLVKKRTASLLVLKGRRRIGKSRLLQEFGKLLPKTYTFSGIPPTPDTTAQQQREEFVHQLQREMGIPGIKVDDWGDIFWHLAQQTEQGSILIILDEISWMGSRDDLFLSKLKNAWDLYFKKNDQLILAICGSVSAWIEENILSSTGFLGRTTMNMTLEELPLTDCMKFWENGGQKISVYEKLKVLAVTGGVPRYLEQIDPTLSAEDNIRQLCFMPESILVNEFEQIFSDLFSLRSTLYQKIVCYLAGGIAEQREIANAVGLKVSGDIGNYLKDLVAAGFISRDYTWHLPNGKPSKLSHYRLKDNYSRFYQKYIKPRKAKILRGDMRDIALSAISGWQGVMGLQIENLVISNRALIIKALHINPNDIVCDNPYFQRKTTKQSGCQIDYLIQTKFNTLYVCEIKFSQREIQPKIIEAMQDKIKRLNKPKHYSYLPVLIHVNGVHPTVMERDYFAYILDLTVLGVG